MRLLAVLVGLVVIVLGVSYLLIDSPTGEDTADALLHTVKRSDFQAFVTEDGDVESASNIEIRCKVKSKNTSGTAILTIIPEGTIVEAGDELLRFDDSHLQEEYTAQQILVARDRAAVIQAKSDLQTARKTLHEYSQGLFEQEKEVLEGEVFVAEETLRRSRTYMQYTMRLAARGFVPPLELDADRFAVEKANKDVAAAKRKLQVYQDFTKDKTVGEYEAEIEKQQANLEAAEHTLTLSQRTLEDVKQQIDNCIVRAPSPGQVIYGNDTDRRGDDRIIIEEGTLVRENQVVIRLPNPELMQVDTTINEVKVNQVKLKQRVRITLDSDAGTELEGTVKQINAFPYPQRWFGGPLEYGCLVQVLNPPRTLRPGQRATVHINVHTENNVLQAPVSSIVEHAGKRYCVVRTTRQRWEARPR